ncbi:ABC transporter permease [Pseudenhygromyxa sp. WMMC2535]|uniref:ABC transporter permease n=1 Tax=Pseudenhygromyxa sp. WMMC2535 TaxID=2712867 RepID=UPI001554B2C0|nr:ABC transporter permease [Pseudenhygromyxa sp. WMMC2535]NVB41764.1 ABC transporter permease [Pseudenhygromyxa sp. WMMC2535]
MFARILSRVLSLIAKDLRTGSRDQLMTYMLLSPFVLGLGFALLMPILEGAGPHFVVSERLDATWVDALAAHGEIERVADREAVVARVLDRDDALGVAQVDHPGALPEVIVEGDEAEALRGLPAAILDHAARTRAGEVLTAVERVPVDPEGARARSQLRLITAALLTYAVSVVVGVMLGFTILEEKTSGVIRTYLVSPLRFWEYLAAKLGLAAVLALAMVVPAVALPLGLSVDWLAIELSTLAGLPFALSMGLIVGVVAKDQLAAIAALKALLPLWTSLPILGFVLPQRWLWTQWAFANHWTVQALFAAMGERTDPWTSAALAATTGVPVLLAVAWWLRGRLGYAQASA